MTLENARKVLGLGPDEDPSGRMEELLAARERLADLVRQAPNDTIALRYQDGLLEFDKALAAVREGGAPQAPEKVPPMVALVPGAVSGRKVVTKRPDFISLKKEPKPEAENPVEMEQAAEPETPVEAVEPEEPAKPVRPEPEPTEIVLPAERETPSAVEPEEEPDWIEKELEAAGPRKRSRWRFAGYLLLFVVVGGVGGGWFFNYTQAQNEIARQRELDFLESFGAVLIRERRWDEARQAFDRIAELEPGSEVAVRGRRGIEVGMEEEEQQFVGYKLDAALAAFDTGRLDEAAEAVGQVLARYPDEKETLELREKIEAARVGLRRQNWEKELRAAIEARDWPAADGGLARMAEELPGDELIDVLSSAIAQAKEQERQQRERAQQLAEAARKRDRGQFDAEALDWMREAVALAPDDPEIKALYDKLASYSRTLRVPEDVPTLAEALAQVRDKDRVVLGEGQFEGGVSINVAVQLEGAGEGKTVVHFPGAKGPAVTLGPGATGANLTGIAFRQLGLDASEERYPVALLRGGEVTFSDCMFVHGSGHGLAVLEGGHGIAVRCSFLANGWDGASARGNGSRMTLRECRADGNVGHGFEVWDGAGAQIVKCVGSNNSRNGILVDSAAEGLQLQSNTLVGNREYGIVLAAGASGAVRQNTCRGNLLGGLLVRFAAISVRVEDNLAEKNRGPGLLLELGLRPDLYSSNRARSNAGRNVATQVAFE